jgi:hypothetical protein
MDALLYNELVEVKFLFVRYLLIKIDSKLVKIPKYLSRMEWIKKKKKKI